MLLAPKETVMRVKVGYARSKKIWGHVDCGEGISGGGWVLLALKETVTRVTIGKVKRSRGVVGHGERICMRRCYLYEEGAI